jgi:hypothetical protein
MSALSPQVAELKELRDQRDAKLTPVVRDFKPAWINDVSVDLSRSELLFDLIYRPYPGRGWVRRRYRYDGQVDVLHFTGELDFPESELSNLSESTLIR